MAQSGRHRFRHRRPGSMRRCSMHNHLLLRCELLRTVDKRAACSGRLPSSIPAIYTYFQGALGPSPQNAPPVLAGQSRRVDSTN